MSSFSPYEAPMESTVEDTLYQTPIDASRGLRFANYIIDRVALIGLGFGLGLILSYINPELIMAIVGIPDIILGIVIGTVYYLIFEGLFGRSIGKFITGTKVINLDGSTPTFGQILGRTLSRFIPFEPFSFLAGDRGWHDSLSKTAVVKIGQEFLTRPDDTMFTEVEPNEEFSRNSDESR